MEKIKMQIFYKNNEVKEIYQKRWNYDSWFDGFDLIVSEDTKLTFDFNKFGEFFVDFGVVVKVPKGYHTKIVPRSSLFKKTGLILANSIGIIDNDYCGKEAFLKGLFVYNDDNMDKGVVMLKKETRIAQLLIRKSFTPELEEFTPGNESRGGFGSTN